MDDDEILEVGSNLVKELEEEYEKEVPSIAIGRKIMDKLERLDEVALCPFSASVYRRYRDVNQFLSEVESLIGRED